MEDASRHDVPYDTCYDLRQKMDSNRQRVVVFDFLHEECEPEVGGGERHHAENSGKDELLGRKDTLLVLHYEYTESAMMMKWVLTNEKSLSFQM